MTDQLSAVGGTGTQQLVAGGTSTIGGGNAVQNLPAGGTSGGEESESQELQKLMKKILDLSGEIGQLKTDKADFESRVVVAEQSVMDMSANFAKEREGLERLIQFYKVQVRCLNNDFSEVLKSPHGASAAAQLLVMRVEMETLRVAKEAAEAEVADLRVKFADAQKALADEKGSTVLTVVELQKKLDVAAQAAKKADQEKGTLNQAIIALEKLCATKEAAIVDGAGFKAEADQLYAAKEAVEAKVGDLTTKLADAQKALTDEKAAMALVVEKLEEKLDAAETARKAAEEHVAGLRDRGLLARLRNSDVQTVYLGG